MSDDVLNLDDLVVEGDEVPFRFVFGGEEYECPPNMDVRAIAALTEGRIDDALRMLVGAANYQRILKADAVLDANRLRALMDAYAAHTGTTLGESRASRRSSRVTVTRSKPTSRGSTKSR